MASRNGSVDPSNCPNEVFDLYSIPAFDNGEPDVVAGSAIGSTKQIVQPGDVLLSKIVPHIRRAWVVGKDRGRRLIASSEWIVFRSDQIEPKYLRHALVCDSFHAKFLSTVSGVGGSLMRARPTHVASIKIPLPPLSDQRRIAEILDAADRIRRKRREVKRLADELPHALFLDFFGQPRSNSKNWPVRVFSDVCESRLGKMLDAKQQTGNHARPYLRNLNVQWGRLDLSSVFEMDFDEDDRKQFRLQPGDVMICEGGAGVGQTAIWRGELVECYFQKSLHRVRPDDAQAVPEYIAYLIWMLMRAGSILDSISTATIPHLTGVKLKSLKIPVPPLTLQKKFAKLVEQQTKISRQTECGIDDANYLFDALVQRAFRGEL